MTEQTAPVAGEDQAEVKTWTHSRKGRIHGAIVRDTGEWVDILLVGDQRLAYVSIAHNLDGGRHDDGEVVTVRRSFLTEVES